MKHIALKITAFIFGIALWLYVVSLNTFKVDLDVPVRLVRLPEMLAIASKPPRTLNVTLEGEPFDLCDCAREFCAEIRPLPQS